MRRWWGSAALAMALLTGFAAPASATGTTESCASNARDDLQSASFSYSTTSFSVSVGSCGDAPATSGEWIATIHLTSFSPEVQITGGQQDNGKYIGWSGFHVCAAASCPQSHPNGFLTPAGPQIDGPCLYTIAACPGVTTSGYAGWADVLPAGTAIPDTIDWYADVRRPTSSDPDFTAVSDRVPDSGTVSSVRNTATVTTIVTATRGASPTWDQFGAVRTDSGRLLDAAGQPVTGRLVRIRPDRYDVTRSESSPWSSTYSLDRNTTVRACFAGDGLHDPSCSDPYPSYVKAFVSLDLPASRSIRKGSPLRLRGVVRPRQSGQVQVLVREDKPGATYRLLRYSSLIQASADSYYDMTWSPTVRGRYVLRARWNGGSKADGSVLSNVSTYRFVTVT